ncbi:hypothetical protein [uncultured Flavobacterium sp.]|uniref:hypothetical protein n=1 Tax=uncultured Flavobacterium sp. TaxID=165435 RepID=UPI0025FC4C0D|nr:hypothetical protein [uncultured Flavobacterium sp.]
MNKHNKILYIDPLLQKGHVNFNNIYIKSLIKAGYNLEFVFVKDYEEQLDIDKSKVVYSLPNTLFKRDYGKLFNRLAYLIGLFFIRFSVNFKKYDFVIFSSFEEISFALSGIKKSYLINHINVSNSYESRIKFFFLDRILMANSLIVLDDKTKEYLSARGDYDLFMVPHGLPDSKVLNEELKEDFHSNILDELKEYRKVIFSPSESSSDKIFINSLIESNQFLKYLEDEKILFIYKDDIQNDKPNVMAIKGYLSQEAYDYLFLKSDVILIAYPERFKYRVSGVLLECIANNKLCAISRIEMLESFNTFFNYDPFFSSIGELIRLINSLVKYKDDNYFKNLNLLEPDFHDFFN